MITSNDVIKDLKKLKNDSHAVALQKFFKTGKGEYGEGDVFLGIKVPLQRKIAKKYNTLSLDQIEILLHSKFHECRLTSLFILSNLYKKSDSNKKRSIIDFYLKNTSYINNWDLVDLSAPGILGDYFFENPKQSRKILYKFAKSKNLWERRISVLTTFAFIINKETKDALSIAELLVNDKHDLIHKAVGWMLREIGKRVSQSEEEKFLKKHYKTMPRTMLRYAIEKFDDKKRRSYM